MDKLGEFININFSKIWERQFEIEIGLMLLRSSAVFYWAFIIGLIMETFEFLGIFFNSIIYLKKDKMNSSTWGEIMFFIMLYDILSNPLTWEY